MSSRAEEQTLARGDGQRALAPDVRLLDRPAGEERAGYADDAEDDLLYGRGEEKVSSD